MYFVIAVVVVLVVALLFACPGSSEGFSSGGAFYTERDFKGARRDTKTVLHEGTFKIWSCETAGQVIKVTAEGLPYMLHLRAERLENLPAALGGLPAHENYTGIFNSGRRVMVELVPLAQAQSEVELGRSYCINDLKLPGATCAAEFAPL